MPDVSKVMLGALQAMLSRIKRLNSASGLSANPEIVPPDANDVLPQPPLTSAQRPTREAPIQPRRFES
jgi:hypothetical protein